MQFTRLVLTNWRNFPSADIELGPRTYVIGPNASGKSNLLGVFRFLRTIAQPDGGGLQQAVKQWGGMKGIRSLHARRNSQVRIEVQVRDGRGDDQTTWRYVLALESEGKEQRVRVAEEVVERNGERVIDPRPSREDLNDRERLTQTHLEQISANQEFRELANFLAGTTYLHLVPQLLKHADEISGNVLEQDPFGQGLMQRIAATSKKIRDARLRRIERTLKPAIPQFSRLEFNQDKVTGKWHLEANFSHWRPQGAWQREDQLSDGTLRLIGLLWALQDGHDLLLLEEPELSLNDAIVERIPLLIDRIMRNQKKDRQIIISTHSEALLHRISDATLLMIEPGKDGSAIRPPTEDEIDQMEGGLTPAEVLLPKIRPGNVDQLGLFQ